MSPRNVKQHLLEIGALIRERTAPGPRLAAPGLGTSEQVIKNHLRSIFDKLRVWSRLEWTWSLASDGGGLWTDRLPTTTDRNGWSQPRRQKSALRSPLGFHASRG